MRRVSPLEKLYYVRLYLSGKGGSQQQCADEAGVTKTAFQHWLRKYETFGESAFLPRQNAKYSEEVKRDAVADYRSGKLTQAELCKKYCLSSMRQIYDWNRQYAKRETPGEVSPDESADLGGRPVLKGRRTTWNERLEIVQYCLAHDRDYTGTAIAFQVSYQQVYTWVRRYDVGGEDYLWFEREKKKSKGKNQ